MCPHSHISSAVRIHCYLGLTNAMTPPPSLPRWAAVDGDQTETVRPDESLEMTRQGDGDQTETVRPDEALEMTR